MTSDSRQPRPSGHSGCGRSRGNRPCDQGLSSRTTEDCKLDPAGGGAGTDLAEPPPPNERRSPRGAQEGGEGVPGVRQACAKAGSWPLVGKEIPLAARRGGGTRPEARQRVTQRAKESELRLKPVENRRRL